jgi:hypothetical protein
MDDAPAARWFTYREFAAETGLTPRAAEARARRMVKAGKWRHRIDNDPPNAARVLVTDTELNVMRDQARRPPSVPAPRARQPAPPWSGHRGYPKPQV